MTSTTDPVFAHSIQPLLNNYDAFIIDLWGVIHDGQTLYPGVLEALELLQEHHKHVIFLSNAPRRAKKAKLVLDRLRITPALYQHIITSGEVTFDQLTSGQLSLGNRFVIIGPDKDDDLLNEASSLTFVDDISNADFIVATGFNEDDSTIEEVRPELSKALDLQLPMICANPDIEVVRIDGSRALCAGVMAEFYQANGGNVISFGKPYPEVYHYCMQHLQNMDHSRIAVIGDNLDTDIKGGNTQSLDSYLIAGGILAEQFNIRHGELPEKNALMALCTQKNIFPTGVLAAFQR